MTRQYQIPKTAVEAAWKLVRSKGGAAGIDGITITDFEENLENNLYKIWNRMSSGSYFPPPVHAVKIPKRSGGQRMLGIPTVGDRVAQQVVKMYLEPLVEPIFHNDSYGYRRYRSPHHAIAQAKQRCWHYDWVLELDIKGYFDSIDHELMLGLVRQHCDEKWILLYVERWLKADLQDNKGTTQKRETGTPQGSVISPVLSNIFLHHVFDTWMTDTFPEAPFERFADDAIIHCESKQQAEYIKTQIILRFREWKLMINEEKTRIVYCKDDNRPGGHRPFEFDFLGFRFQPRRALNKRDGIAFTSFQPAISPAAYAEIYEQIRDWELTQRISNSLAEIRNDINAQIRGWFNYYGKFYGSALTPLHDHIDARLVYWAVRKYKRLRTSITRGHRWLQGLKSRQPALFAHWSPTS